MTKPIIYLLTIQYYPDFGGAAIRTRNIARMLSYCGFKVVVITSVPQYIYGKPTYKKYRNKIIIKESENNNLLIYRFLLPPVPHNNIINRLIRYIFYTLFSIFMSIYVMKKENRPDIIYAHFPPIFSYFTGYLISNITKSALVYDIHDLLPEQLETIIEKPNKLSINILRIFARYLYGKPKFITGCSKTMLNYVKRQYRINQLTYYLPTGLETINWKISKEKARRILIKLGIFDKSFIDKIIFIYAGTMDPAQDLETIVRAFTKANLSDSVLLMFGEGKCKNKLKNISKNIPNIYIYDSVPRKLLDLIINASDIGIVSLKPTKGLRFNIPTKIFDYIMNDKIVLFNTNSLEIINILEKYKIGLLTHSSENHLRDSIVYVASLVRDKKKLKYYLKNIEIYKNDMKIEKLSRKLCNFIINNIK